MVGLEKMENVALGLEIIGSFTKMGLNIYTSNLKNVSNHTKCAPTYTTPNCLSPSLRSDNIPQHTSTHATRNFVVSHRCHQSELISSQAKNELVFVNLDQN